MEEQCCGERGEEIDQYSRCMLALVKNQKQPHTHVNYKHIAPDNSFVQKTV
jgi:hypothetical protein